MYATDLLENATSFYNDAIALFSHKDTTNLTRELQLAAKYCVERMMQLSGYYDEEGERMMQNMRCVRPMAIES